MRILIILMLSGTLGVLGCDSSSTGTGGAGGGTDPAAAFCAEYGVECGFDGSGYASDDDCRTAYNGYDVDRQTCVVTHLGLAVSTMDTLTHCPHAAGAAPCD
jgi:hypothetical protein